MTVDFRTFKGLGGPVKVQPHHVAGLVSDAKNPAITEIHLVGGSIVHVEGPIGKVASDLE